MRDSQSEGGEPQIAQAARAPAVRLSLLGMPDRVGPVALAAAAHSLQRSAGNAAMARLVGRCAASKRRLARFEAPVHEAAERQGLTSDAAGALAPGGLTNEEASAVYLGNWMRDINQVFVPLVKRFLADEVVFSLVAYLGAKKFGRAFTPEQFGYYIPAEHIDNPAGLTWEDDLRQTPPTVSGAPVVPGAKPRPAPYVTRQERPEPTSTALGVPEFAVDQTGTLAYIRRTNVHVEKRLELAARSGRNPEGMMHFGAALHAIEDVFAHSNWVEMAVNQILKDNPDVLPALKGSARQVFAFSKEQDIGGGKIRPVLMTGSFTGADTKISIASEVVTFMSEPLPEPSTPAEQRAEERFMTTLLRTYEAQLKGNREFRRNVEQALKQNGCPDSAVPIVMNLPLADAYQITRIHVLPDWVKEKLIIPIKRVFRQQVSQRVLQPAARAMQAETINARVADTSLIKFMRDQVAATSQTLPAPGTKEREALDKMAGLTGRTAQQQLQEDIDAAKRHVAALQATPERVVGGPTHSQIAKDHPNSPFYGLAVTVAAEAVRRMREKMLAAWEEESGAVTTPFNFDPSNFPATSGVPADQAAEAKENRDLYQETRTKRKEKEGKSLERGNRVLSEGGDVRVEEGKPPPKFKAYDVSAMRSETVSQIKAVAQGLRGLVGAPADAAAAAEKLKGMLGGLDVQAERLQKARELLGRFVQAGQAASSGPDAAALRKLADELDSDAAAIDAARTVAEREKANRTLAGTRDRVIGELHDKTPSTQSGLASAAVTILDLTISDTAPAYSTEQLGAIGGADLPDHPGPNDPLQTATVTLPDITKTFDPALHGGTRGPKLQALIAESRLLLNHPYESSWWVDTVRGFMKRFPDVVATDIEARNSGYSTLRRPGEARSGDY